MPVNNIKVYVDFLSFFRANLIIKKINLLSGELNIIQISKLSSIIKPSTFKSLLNNKIKEGKLISEIEIFLKDDGSIKDFIVKGTIRNLKVELFNNINLKKTNLSFFADKNDILIKNIFGFLEEIKISDGDIRLNLENGIKLNSNFNSKIDLSDQVTKKYIDFFKKYDVVKGLRTIKADLNNNFSIIVNIGPGRFSSIRTSLSVAKGMKIAKNINIYGFNNSDLDQFDVVNVDLLITKGLLQNKLIKPRYLS